MQPKDRILIALDVDSNEKAFAIIDEIRDYVGGFKINSLFNEEGPQIVKEIIEKGGKVFLDLKYHDIPNTVANYASAATKLGVYMFNIHSTGGFEMMKSCVESAEKTALEFNVKKPIILAVTVLTSIDQEALNKELNVNVSVEEQVVHLALLAKQAGCDGVVASAKETKLIKKACGDDFLVVTPGIRPLWASSGDQKRIVTPKQALEDGSDYLVIGRAITDQEDRVKAVKKIINELSFS
jgi:orotidine-5'-phosphate decarboxylase